MNDRFPRACSACGRRFDGAGSLCPACKAGGRPRVCGRCRSLALPGENYCAAHKAEVERERQSRQSYRAGYDDPANRASRARRYLICKGFCESCGAPLRGKLHPEGVRWECDHVVELSEGGTNDVSNRRCYCVPCHRAKTARNRSR